jgi:hypothetical protein
MVFQRWAGGTATCGSGDAKDTTVPAGTLLTETDTRKKYYFDGTEWIAQDFPAQKRFKVYNQGSKTYVVDLHGKVQGSATEAQDAINPILAAQGNNTVYYWEFDTSAFTIYEPILVPSNILGFLKKNIFRNEAFSTVRSGSSGAAGGVTTLIPHASFPTNRYLFETSNPNGAGTSSSVEINGFQATNVSNYTSTDVGFCRLEGDLANGGFNWVVKNCYFNYLWRGIHLIGFVWWGLFEDVMITISDPAFEGDAPLILEDGGHVNPATNPTPKGNYFRNIQTQSGDGVYNDFLRMQSGGYNMFENILIDGKYYTNAIFTLNNTDALAIHQNRISNVLAIDIEIMPGSNVQGSLYMAGTSVFDNVFEKCRWPICQGKTVKLEGAGVMNNDIEIISYWGGAVPVVSHVSSGESNTIRVFTGSKSTAGNVPITLSGTTPRCRVIDARRGAEMGGIATSRTDGSTIAHGLFATPAWYFVTGTVANEIVTATADATNLTVAIKKRADGLAGTSQSIAWKAGVYA